MYVFPKCAGTKKFADLHVVLACLTPQNFIGVLSPSFLLSYLG